MSTSLHIKFAVFAHLAEGKFERGAENGVKCQQLRYEILHMSVREGQNFD